MRRERRTGRDMRHAFRGHHELVGRYRCRHVHLPSIPASISICGIIWQWRRRLDALELIALINRLYDYGRRSEEAQQGRRTATRDELETKARIYGFESPLPSFVA